MMWRSGAGRSSRWNGFHSGSFPLVPVPIALALFHALVGPEKLLHQIKLITTPKHITLSIAILVVGCASPYLYSFKTNLMKHSILSQKSASQQNTDCCWEYAAVSMSGVIMAGKLYLPKSLPPDQATLKAVREAAKVAHNRELSWDPFNLRIAIKPIKPN
jgi:hypothetical protein